VLRFSAGARDSYSLQKCPKDALVSTQPSSEWVLPAGKRRWRDAYQLFPSSPEVMNEYSYTFTPSCTFAAYTGGQLTLLYFHSYLFIPCFFSLYFLLLIAISVSAVWNSIKAKVNRV
jgi:hypothetical protein